MGAMKQPNIISAGGAGWIRITWPDRPYRVLARTVERNGRRVIVDLVVRSDGNVDSSALKSLPIGWLEGLVNAPDWAKALGRRDSGATTPTGEDMAEVLTMLEIGVDGMAFGVDQPSEQTKRPPLSRPDGADPDDFYRRVADAYHDVLQRSGRVAPALAEEAGVPVATVRRWIQESRRRGFLPPARRGRAG